MNRSWGLVCGICGTACEDSEAVACTSCGGPTVVRYEMLRPSPSVPLPMLGEERRGEGGGIWRYRGWLPLGADESPVSLGEGDTPLVRLAHWPGMVGLESVYAKLEYSGPTGSFKDRGASVLISHAVAAGARRIVEDSSGNAGAAIAAYAARAGIECQVFAPASAPAGKLAQIRAFGAELIAVEGSREAVADAARSAAAEDGVYYAGHNSNPYFVEGTKTFGFEVAEAFAPGGPDHIVMPVGGGSLFCGTAIALGQLRSAGLAGSLPHLHLVQSNGCMPLVAAFGSGANVPIAVERHPTIAGGIVIEHPDRGVLILRALRDSGGHAVAVSDEQILEAQASVARLDGIYMEATSAAAFAGLVRLAAMNVIRREHSVVVPVTGSGLKDPLMA